MDLTCHMSKLVKYGWFLNSKWGESPASLMDSDSGRTHCQPNSMSRAQHCRPTHSQAAVPLVCLLETPPCWHTIIWHALLLIYFTIIACIVFYFFTHDLPLFDANLSCHLCKTSKEVVKVVHFFRRNIKYKSVLQGVFILDREAGEIIRLVVSVCLFVCQRSPVWTVSYTLKVNCNKTDYYFYLLKKHQREFISRSIQNCWAFKIVVVSTGCAIAVDHAFNL